MSRPPTEFGNRCKWVVESLLGKDRQITRKDFAEHFKLEDRDASEWSRLSTAIQQSLEFVGYKIHRDDQDGSSSTLKFIDPPASGKPRYQTPRFDPTVDEEQKKKIGELVAKYLRKRKDRNVVLGSGTTVYHVGLAMSQLAKNEKQPYSQLFWTVNIPLLAYWCEELDESNPEKATPTVDQVLIPKGTLAIKNFRYSAMSPPTWNAPIVVVGADGCCFNRQTNSARFFGNEESIAAITNTFIETAVDTVICCLSSTKLRFDGGGQQAGPWIDAPTDRDIQRFLVTDELPSSENLEVLKASSWRIVTNECDWDPPDSKDMFPASKAPTNDNQVVAASS